MREALPIANLRDLLMDAKAEGYEVASFSGGEPLLYRSLPAALEHAKSLGLNTTLTTNGMTLTRRKIGQIRGLVDLIAISLDGKPERHNKMRGSKHAFRALEQNLTNLRRSGIPFGFIHTVTADSLQDLRWVTEYAIDAGAQLLQLHPLEMVGNAATSLAKEAIDREVCSRVYLLALLLRREFEDAIRIHVDVVNALTVLDNPDFACTRAPAPGPERPALSAVINPLVIDSNGDVLPVCYGMNRKYLVGNLFNDRLGSIADEYVSSRFGEFRELCQQVYEFEVLSYDEDALPFFNWYESLAARSHGPEKISPSQGLARLHDLVE